MVIRHTRLYEKIKIMGGYHIYENNLSVRKIKVFFTKKL